MPKNRVVIYNPKIDEYIFDVLSNLTHDQLRNLSPTEIRLITPNKSLRKFATWGKLDKKLAILTKAGVEWSIQFYKHPEHINEAVSKVYRQYTMKRLRADNIAELRKRDVFVVTHRQYMQSLAMLAQDCHSEVYFLNPKFIAFHRTQHAFATAKKARPLNPEYNDGSIAYKQIAAVMFHGRMMDSVLKYEGFEPVDGLILYYVYQFLDTFIGIEVIQRAMESEYTPRTVATHCQNLSRSGHLDKLYEDNHIPKYTITGKGIQLIGRVIGRVADAAIT